MDFRLLHTRKPGTWSCSSVPPVSLPITHPDLPKKKRKAWRDAGEEVRGLFYHRAMADLPNVRAFTLMLWLTFSAALRPRGSIAYAGCASEWSDSFDALATFLRRSGSHSKVRQGRAPCSRRDRCPARSRKGSSVCAQVGGGKVGPRRRSIAVLKSSAGFPLGWLRPQERPQGAARAASVHAPVRIIAPFMGCWL